MLQQILKNCNIGLICPFVRTPLASVPCNSLFAGNFKLRPIVKVCTVLKEIPKIIQREEEKGHFSPQF